MLYPVYKFKEQFEWALSEIAMDSDYFWWHGDYVELTKNVDTTMWSAVQLVSVDPNYTSAEAIGPLVGYLSAYIRRPHFYVDGISLVNFRPGRKNIFASDVRAFFNYLIADMRIRKIVWGCGEGSPSMGLYKRLHRLIGARQVAKYTKHYLTPDNTLHNYFEFEFLNDCFVCTHCGYAEKNEQEVKCWKCGLGEMVYYEVRPSWVKKVKYNGISI